MNNKRKSEKSTIKSRNRKRSERKRKDKRKKSIIGFLLRREKRKSRKSTISGKYFFFYSGHVQRLGVRNCQINP